MEDKVKELFDYLYKQFGRIHSLNRNCDSFIDKFKYIKDAKYINIKPCDFPIKDGLCIEFTLGYDVRENDVEFIERKWIDDYNSAFEHYYRLFSNELTSMQNKCKYLKSELKLLSICDNHLRPVHIFNALGEFAKIKDLYEFEYIDERSAKIIFRRKEADMQWVFYVDANLIKDNDDAHMDRSGNLHNAKFLLTFSGSFFYNGKKILEFPSDMLPDIYIDDCSKIGQLENVDNIYQNLTHVVALFEYSMELSDEDDVLYFVEKIRENKEFHEFARKFFK